MALTKTKSLSISVIVLSVLFVISLVSTIILASFTLTSKASTSLSFASSVQITATNGLTADGKWQAYLVNKTGTIGSVLSSTEEITQGIALAPVRVRNDTSKEITVAVAVVISAYGTKSLPSMYAGTTTAVGTTALADSTQASPNFANGTTYISAKINNTGTAYKWATFTLGANGQTNAESFVTKYLNTGYNEAAINELADKGFTATLYFAAVYTTQDVATAIASADIVTTTWTVA